MDGTWCKLQNAVKTYCFLCSYFCLVLFVIHISYVFMLVDILFTSVIKVIVLILGNDACNIGAPG